MLKKIKAFVLLAAVIQFGRPAPAPACGPFFPNHLLDGGDEAVLQAPVADFQRELVRMRLVSTRLQAVRCEGGQSLRDQSVGIEMGDLASALRRRKISLEQATVILQGHRAARTRLDEFLAAQEKWKAVENEIAEAQSSRVQSATNPSPVFPCLAATPGLPSEFAVYFSGAIAWHRGERGQAWLCWQRLLELPPAERQFKTTWAAFMLAKCSAAQAAGAAQINLDVCGLEQTQALKYFQQVREFARRGFADSLGLATASLGEEARIFLDRKDYERAIELYLEQFAAGEKTAVQSLRLSAVAALAQTNAALGQLKVLAKNPRTRLVITAYLISRHPYLHAEDAEAFPEARCFFDRTTAWLDAVEAAGVGDVESAEQLALAAYQASRMDMAKRWIRRAGGEPVAQWLQAKLLLRDGRTAEAAGLLRRLSRRFPQQFPSTNATASFAQSLQVDPGLESAPIPVGRQVLGELGVLHLSRREFTEALDALLRSGYWMDAAYVAERVLTTDELKVYVDREWPAAASRHELEFENGYDYRESPLNIRQRIRYLLARRLAREARYDEARGCFPSHWARQLQWLVSRLNISCDVTQPTLQRTLAMVDAASLTRTNGMELFGTELQPDWFLEHGDFEAGVTWEGRATDTASAKINHASADELDRAAVHGVEPEERWHYRSKALDLWGKAAALAWLAAKSMPDNSDDTARFLCTAGRWARSPEVSDKFYKALVRRCRATAIGAQADRLRWFPVLDKDGNPKPSTLRKASGAAPGRSFASGETNSLPPDLQSIPQPGTTWTVTAGSTVSAIARQAGVAVESILLANPGLDPALLRVGQMIKIPLRVAKTAR